jgi:hypothetical protein
MVQTPGPSIHLRQNITPQEWNIQIAPARQDIHPLPPNCRISIPHPRSAARSAMPPLLRRCRPPMRITRVPRRRTPEHRARLQMEIAAGPITHATAHLPRLCHARMMAGTVLSLTK